MNKIASRAKLAILKLLKIPAYFFPQSGLITYQLIDSMGEEASISVSAESFLGPAFTKLYFSLDRGAGTDLIID